MLRLLLIPICVSALAAAVFHVTPWLFLIPIGGGLLYMYTKGGYKARCPRCGGAIKIGYDTCRHCNWTSREPERYRWP